MRYKLTIEYDGTPFFGFQLQPQLPTVQGALEKAFLSLIHQEIRVYGAGRTDQGVHALGQVVHVDIDKEWDLEKLKFGLNHFLNNTMVCVIKIEHVSDDFHSRFGAKHKQYLYRIINRHSPLTLEAGKAWHVGNQMDANLMHEGAQFFVGTHDFSSFRDSDCQAKSPIKTIIKASVQKAGDEIRFIFEGRSFLHHQVRNMVGTLKLLGHGKLNIHDIKRILDAKDRTKAGQTAPPQGLYLMWINYE
jgi:tRNA pseudouridine38-40 synthase